MRNINTFEGFHNMVFEIYTICNRYGIEKYTINKDGSIDVNGDVGLQGIHLNKIPIKFNRVNGHFDCYNNELISLEGCPKYVGGDFSCISSGLKSLIGSPIEVGGDFFCNDNYLKTLEGGPRIVGGYMNCSNNELITLEGAPEKLGDIIDCLTNPVYEIWKLIDDRKHLELFLDYDIIRNDRIVVLHRLNDLLDLIGKSKVSKVEGYKCI